MRSVDKWQDIGKDTFLVYSKVASFVFFSLFEWKVDYTNTRDDSKGILQGVKNIIFGFRNQPIKLTLRFLFLLYILKDQYLTLYIFKYIFILIKRKIRDALYEIV